MARRSSSPSAKQRGQGGEDQAALTLKLLGFDVHSVGAKQLRYFRDKITGQTRLGWALKDDGDFLGLFDVLAWRSDLSMRLQVKDWTAVVAPDAKWRRDVAGLHHPPATVDCWWSRDTSGDYWWSWERTSEGVWVYRALGLDGRYRSAPLAYVPGRRRIGP